jgi:hypothetical protein
MHGHVRMHANGQSVAACAVRMQAMVSAAGIEPALARLRPKLWPLHHENLTAHRTIQSLRRCPSPPWLPAGGDGNAANAGAVITTVTASAAYTAAAKASAPLPPLVAATSVASRAAATVACVSTTFKAKAAAAKPPLQCCCSRGREVGGSKAIAETAAAQGKTN